MNILWTKRSPNSNHVLRLLLETATSEAELRDVLQNWKLVSSPIVEVVDGSATMFPRSGPGIVQLSQAEFRLYRDMVRQNGMSSSIEKALDGMISVGNNGVSSESRSKLNELYRSRDLGK